MKKSIYLVCVAVLLAFTNTANAAKIEVYKVKSPLSVKVYADPTIHSAVIGKIPGKSTWIVKRSKKHRYYKHYWIKISWNNTTGWVRADKLSLDKKATQKAKSNKRCLSQRNRPRSCDK